MRPHSSITSRRGMKSRVKDSRRANFEAIYDRHNREVWALAYARWLNADLAQDIMQETFLRLWRQILEGAKIDNPRAWLLRVARNLAEDLAKSSFRRNGTQNPQTMSGVRGKEEQPIEGLERAEMFQQIRAELNLLAAADREILTLRYSLDYDATEIAEMLEINATAVHMRLSRARQRLAERLTAKGIKEIP